MLSPPLPPDLGQFVQQQLALGKYQSEQELYSDAVRVLREVKKQEETFRDDIELGIAQLDRGEANDYDFEQLRERFEQLKDRARRRIAGNKDGE
jgi:putative addiction module CopG family antidote